MSIYIKRLDLTEPYENNIKLLKNAGIPIIKADTKLIVCNFAIHYLIGTAKKLNNIVHMVNNLLASGGRFIFTCLDGQKVFNLLNASPSHEWGDGEKYLIRPKYTSTEFETNQKIDIMLPFSYGKLYTEYLVNLEAVQKAFEKSKFKLESCNSFETFIEFDSITNSFDEWDRQYVKLLNFSVYYKC
jgi:hypothetical protein